MSAVTVDLNVALTPEQVAQAFWGLGSDGQVRFFAELDRVAGVMLCFQMAGVVRDMAMLENDTGSHAMNGFRTMLAHAAEYANDSIDLRCSAAKAEIAAMVRDKGRHRFTNPYGAKT